MTKDEGNEADGRFSAACLFPDDSVGPLEEFGRDDHSLLPGGLFIDDQA